MNKMRRLPGPACCRLSEGHHPPEALYELFRDWQRTQTQSSVKALRSPRLQMDVWFCRAQEPMPRGTLLRVEHPEIVDLHALPSAPETPVPSLDRCLHGCRQPAPYSPAPDSDHVLIKPRPPELAGVPGHSLSQRPTVGK